MTGLLSSRPLLDNAADAAFFVDRSSELDTTEKAVRLGFNALVRGERGSGKTSFLRAVGYRLRDVERPFVFMDGAAAGSAADLLALLRERLFGPEVVTVTTMMKNLERLVGQREIKYQAPTSQLLLLIDRLREAFEAEEVEAADEASQHAERGGQQLLPHVVLLDGLPGEGGQQLFGRLRDELWSLPLIWIVAVDPSTALRELRPPADAFFETVIDLGPFDYESARELLSRRVPSDESLNESDIAAIIDGSNGLPRHLIDGLRRVVVEGRSPEQLRIEREDQERRLRRLGDAAVRIAEVLRDSGGSSASDEDFLQETDLSRSTAARVLKRMESEGLVRSQLEKGDSQGRPRRVYRVAPEGGRRA